MIRETFPYIYWINLERRPDRRERMEARLSEQGIAASRFPAFDGAQLKIPSDFDGLPGGYGFNLSQLGVMAEAVGREADPILIFEDDAVFCPNFHAEAAAFLREVPADWQLLYFGCNTAGAKLERVSERVARVRNAYTTHAYALRLETARLILNHPDRYKRTLDAILHRLQSELKAYCAVPSLVTQEVGYSDILNAECDYTRLIL